MTTSRHLLTCKLIFKLLNFKQFSYLSCFHKLLCFEENCFCIACFHSLFINFPYLIFKLLNFKQFSFVSCFHKFLLFFQENCFYFVLFNFTFQILQKDSPFFCFGRDVYIQGIWLWFQWLSLQIQQFICLDGASWSCCWDSSATVTVMDYCDLACSMVHLQCWCGWKTYEKKTCYTCSYTQALRKINDIWWKDNLKYRFFFSNDYQLVISFV